MNRSQEENGREFMTECYDTGKEKVTFSLILGSLYILFGILQAIASTGIVDILLVPGNIMGTFVLTVIGSVFLFGHKELEEGINEGVAYIVVGIMLSLIFGALYLLVMGADAVSAYILSSEDFQDWTPLDDLRPELYLSFLSVFGYYRWRDEFSMEEIMIPEGSKMKGEGM